MAKATSVFTCPRCEGSVTKEQTACSSCGYILQGPQGSPFESPDYIVLQRRDIVESYKNTVKSEQKKEILEQELNRDIELWFKACLDSDRQASVEDALNMVRSLMVSNASIGTIKTVTKLGRQIGDMCTAIELYASKGGSFNATPAITRPNDNIEDIDQA